MVEEEYLPQDNEVGEDSTMNDSFSPDELLQRFGMQETSAETETVEEEPEELDETIVEPEPTPVEAEPAAIPEDLLPEPPQPPTPSETEETDEVAMSLEEMSASEELLPDPFATDDLLGESDQRSWFVIHCYSGSEQKVKHNLEQRIESMDMQNYIFQVVVPTVEEIEIKEGERRNVERCLYPGYILVQMIQTDDSWYVVRNTPGVTGFVGMGNKPIPLRADQVKGILHRMEAEAPQIRATFKPGQKVRIIEGPFADFIGVVEDLDEERAKLHVLVSFFGRETPVELDFLQVEKT